MSDEALARVLLAIFLVICWAGVMWLICRRTKSSDIPSGMPIVLIPVVLLIKAQLKLWRSQRIRAFLKLADDLRMRKKSVNRRLPRGPSS